MQTKLLKAGAACKKVVRGIDLLLEQAMLQNYLFTGKKIEASEASSFVTEMIEVYMGQQIND
jgi:shikimate 5-dehydrogenase